MLKQIAAGLIVAAAFGAQTAAEAQRQRETPYWASISSGRAMMRTGPGRNFPASWLYVRRDLPIQVVEVHESWRKVRDPDGASGWMLVNLLSDQRTAIVRGGEPQPMHQQADAASPIAHRAEPGVVGRISDCQGGWCRFDAQGRSGFIRTGSLWGVDEGERL